MIIASLPPVVRLCRTSVQVLCIIPVISYFQLELCRTNILIIVPNGDAEVEQLQWMM